MTAFDTIRTIVILAALPAAALPEQSGPWEHSLVDSGGRFSSLRFDRNGNGHVAYLDEPNHTLKYAFWDRHLDKWFTTEIDRSRGFCSLTLDSQQRPHISYLAYGGSSHLKYAHWDGGAWSTQFINIRAKDISFYTSIALDSKEYPHITYYEYQGMADYYRLHLREVAWTGSFWQVKTVDSTPGSGKFNAMAADAAGNFHIVYANVKEENASLRYAFGTGSSWNIQVLEGGPERNAYIYSVFLAIDKDGAPHLAYTDVRNRTVKYAVQRKGKWEFQILDTLAEVSYPDRYGITLDESGNPYVSYYDPGAGRLKLAHHAGDKWAIEVVDANFAGFTSSVQIAGGMVWITYFDEGSNTLKCARRRLASGEITLSSRGQP